MPFSTLEEFASIISDIYDCAVDDTRWVKTLARISSRLNAEYVAVNLMPVQHVEDAVLYSSPWDSAAQHLLFTKYIPLIPGIDAMMSCPVDHPVSSLSVVPEEQARQSRFYQEWALPRGLRDGAVTKYAESSGAIGFITCVTSLGRDPISPTELEALRMLSPHMRRAVMIGDIMSRQRVEADSYAAVLGALSLPIVLLGRTGAIRYANAAGDALLQSGSLFTVRQSEVVPVDGAARASFAEALARATAEDGALGRRGIGLPLRNGRGQPSFAYVLPLGQTDARAFGAPMAAVFITSSDRQRPPPVAVLMTMFDLTPAEARLALMIGQGLSLADASDRLAVAQSTLRTHLSNIFAKTATTRQADLASLVSTCSLPVEMTPAPPAGV